MKKALNLHNKVYCHNCSILLLVITANFLLCLINKLNFIVGMYVQEKNRLYIGFSTIRARFQASTGGSWKVSPVDKGGLLYMSIKLLF